MIQYPSALVGMAIILILTIHSIWTVIAIPQEQAILLWRAYSADEQGKTIWYQNPKTAAPIWVNWFRKEKLPLTIIQESRDDNVPKIIQPTASGNEILIPFTFDFQSDAFPQDLILFFESQYAEKLPHISLTWLTSDGREIDLRSFSISSDHKHTLSIYERLQRKFKGVPVIQALFGDPSQDFQVPTKGNYELQVEGLTFEENSRFEVEMVVYGQVAGIAGTDHQRRDLKITLLWGTPIALAFGILGALAPSLAAMVIAAIGVWFGGGLDELIQRLTEVNIILPTLPVAIMIYVMYSKSIWVILGVIILLSIFGSAVKNYRAAFIQIKEAPYIEGAQA